jgi:50S ribosomal subunit-associated GTPase HflX
MLKTELDLYKPGLSSLPAAIVANKIDILEDLSKQDYVRTQFTGIPLPLVAVSGKLGTNIADLKAFIRKLYEQNVN